MSEFSSEESENTSGEVRRWGFGDFMFGSHLHHHESSSSDSSSGDQSSSESPSGTKTNPSRVHPGNCAKSKWQDSKHGGDTQTKICWANGNMWEYRKRRRPRWV